MCCSKPQTGVSLKCRRLLLHLRGRGCPVSAGPPRHPPHSPLPHHPPTSSFPMASHIHHPPNTHTAPHNPHSHYTPTPSPLHHPPHSTTHAPTTSTTTPLAPSNDPMQVPPVGHAQPPRGSLDTLLPSEARVSHRVPRGCREEGRQGSPKCWVQVSGAEDPLCPASAHCLSWSTAHPAQDTSP